MDFGVIVPQGWRMDLVGIADPAEAYEAMSRVAQQAEELGFYSAWLYDHFHTVPRPTQEITFECWTSTAALARDTQRIRIGQIVTCNSYRNPALLAKMASTVDALSHGRLICGIGAGWHEQEYRAYGYDFPSAKERLARLREAVQILLTMWTQPEAYVEGKYYQINGAINQPKGVQKPHIPLLIGGGGEKVTLKIVAQYADACNVGGDIATIKHKLEVLKQHCEDVGRDYNKIRRTVNIDYCALAPTVAQARAKLPPEELEDIEKRESSLIGTPQMMRQRIAEYEEVGIQELIIHFVDAATNPEALSLFAQECMKSHTDATTGRAD
jgi:F420-dependent oxidoreductase-like protein